MNTSLDGQNLASVPRWTEQERERYAAQIAPARKALGLSQTDLSERSEVARRTIGSIERGQVIPQAGVLKRLMVALDIYPADIAEYSEATQGWIGLIAPLIESLPGEVRQRYMLGVVAELGQAVRRLALECPAIASPAPAAGTTRAASHATTVTEQDIRAGAPLPQAAPRRRKTPTGGTTATARTSEDTI